MAAPRRMASSVAMLSMAAASCTVLIGCSRAPVECAGQCKAPYELDAAFRPHTSKVLAQKALARCAALPTVIRVAGLRRTDTGQWEGRIYTTRIGRSPATQPLLTCLDSQRVIVPTAGWPD
jgi:hypothetical protein